MTLSLDGQSVAPIRRGMALFSTNEIAGLVVFYGWSLNLNLSHLKTTLTSIPPEDNYRDNRSNDLRILNESLSNCWRFIRRLEPHFVLEGIWMKALRTHHWFPRIASPCATYQFHILRSKTCLAYSWPYATYQLEIFCCSETCCQKNSVLESRAELIQSFQLRMKYVFGQLSKWIK